jgi:hypothetical protein
VLTNAIRVAVSVAVSDRPREAVIRVADLPPTQNSTAPPGSRTGRGGYAHSRMGSGAPQRCQDDRWHPVEPGPQISPPG